MVSCGKDPVRNYVWGYDGNGKNTDTDIPEGADKSLCVGSFNIRYYNTTDTYPWTARKEAVKSFIEDRKPDFLGIQELRPTQAQDIALYTADNYGFYSINRDTGTPVSSSSSGEGVGILYNSERFTIEKKGFFWLAENPDTLPDQNADGTYSSWNSACRRVVLWVKAKDAYRSDETVYFFATHFDHKSSDARAKSSDLTISKIKEITGITDLANSSTPIFLVADFNCTLNSTELATIRSNMKDARTSASTTDQTNTYNGWKEGGSSIIDHIFYAGTKLSADKYEVVTKNYGVDFISDHYPILLTNSYR